jgi:hypothetical protein
MHAIPPNYLRDVSSKLTAVEGGAPIGQDLIDDVEFVSRLMTEQGQPSHPLMRQIQALVERGTRDSGKIASAMVRGVQSARSEGVQQAPSPNEVHVKPKRDLFDYIGAAANVAFTAFALDGIFGGFDD